jgi:hypothetical protein
LKSIYTLLPDIQEILSSKGGWFTDDLSREFADEISQRLRGQFQERTEARTLRLSQMGPRCPKALWHSLHTPDEAESLPPWAEFKFAFGHIIEGLAVAFAKAAGHEVTGEQDAVSVGGVIGHRDCIIDGCLVDVKSASSFSFNKFNDGSIAESDTFGYLDQLDGYLVGSADDPLLRVKDRAYLLAVDKQLGHMCLYEHRLRKDSIIQRVEEYKKVAGLPNAPRCTCGTKPVGASGNIGLDVRASYSPYKFNCFPSLRTFLYSKGPVYLSHVEKVPDVPEIDRYGQPVFH